MTTTLTREDLRDDVYLFTVHGDLDATGALAIQDDVELAAAVQRAGNVYLSMLWHLPARAVPGLSIAIGVCVAEATTAVQAPVAFVT